MGDERQPDCWDTDRTRFAGFRRMRPADQGRIERENAVSLTYFAKTNNATEELWVSDGTVAGTHLVRALGPSGITALTTIGARAYFAVDDGTHGNELWTSDGTAAGTVLVDDIKPGAAGSFPLRLVNVNRTLFFSASDGVNGFELWKSDGSAAGTALVKDINPGAGNSAPVSLTNVNGALFFSAFDPAHGFELWKSDGTAAGTVLVKDINPGAGDSNAQSLTNVNGTLFFEANDNVHGFELWKSDGTAAGTVMVKDIDPGAVDSNPQNLTNVNGTLFFSAFDPVDGVELWKSDGTAAGTVMVKDINPGAGDSGVAFPINVNGTLFFEAFDGVNGVELWKSDGTAAGTLMVKDINPGAAHSIPQGLTNVNGTVFFNANDGVNGFELWKSDGTAAGTLMVKDINPGAGGSSPFALANVNGVLEFYAFNGTGFGLFRSNGTAAGTIELASNVDTNVPIGFSSSPSPLPNDLNGDHRSDILWRNTNGALADWTMTGGIISSGFLTLNGTVVAPGATWSVAGISDFNADSNADVLWRNADGTLAEWTMNGSIITSSAALTFAGVAEKPDASWSVAGVGDFDGDTRSDILWRNTSGELVEWRMNGATIASSGDITANGVAAKPDASWSVAGIGDFNGDGRRDILWRNSSGEVVDWLMNGATIVSSGDLTSAGVAARPDASWSIAGVGDFNHDGNSDILWRNTNGSLAEWLMNGSTITSSGTITLNGTAVMPDAAWHVVEVGDFNGDGNSDILWRSDSGGVAEWLMNGTAISQSMSPASNGTPISPDPTWSTQARPTNFG